MSEVLKGFFGYKKLFFGAIILLVFCLATVVMLVAEQAQDKPDHAVKVKSFWPEEFLNSREPGNIMIKFTRDLMPADSIDILTADFPLEIDPPIPGLAKWIAPDKLVFFPDSLYRPSTEYMVKVLSTRAYLFGNRINEPRVFKFRTPTFIVRDVSSRIIDVAEPPSWSRLLVQVNFNYAVDPQELGNYILASIKSKRGDIKFEVSDKTPSEELTLTSEPFKAQETNGEFTFTVTKGLNCIGGQIPLQTDFQKTIDIPRPEPLVINQVYSHGAGTDTRIIIYLSQPVPLAEAKAAITLTPEADYIVNQHYSNIELLGNFKPRTTYTIEIKRGLRSSNGQVLERDFSSIIEIGDLEPRIGFIDNGLYMSKKSRQQLAVETVNISEITVEVEQIFVNNIIYYIGDQGRDYYGSDNSRVGRKIFTKDFKLQQTQNTPLNSTIDIGKIVGDTLQGIYNVSVRAKDRRWDYAEKRVLITDLGILARLSDDYMMVWVNSLSGIGPVSDVNISLISRNNQTLLEGKTDSRGIIVFESIAEKTAGFEPYVITASKGTDLSFLQFNECMIYTADMDVTGRPYLVKGYESFIYSDRGVYRPGETVHLVSVTRGQDGGLTPEFPYMINIKDPQGRDFQEYKLTTKDKGLSAIDIDMPDFAKTGSYAVTAKIGEQVIGQHSFQVEEFMPDRIKATLTTDKDVYYAGDEIKIDVNGAYLFGPPCAGNTVNGHLTIESDYFSPKAWSGYTFVDPDVQFAAIQADLQTDKLDEAGNYKYTYKLSSNLRPPSSLKVLISATVLEDGGRAVSAFKAVAAHPYPIYLGLQKASEGYVQPGKAVLINAVSVDGKGSLVSLDSGWVKFYRVVYQNIVKKDSRGIYRYVSEEKDQLIDSAFVSILDKAATVRFTPTDEGGYKAKFVSSRTAHSTTISFYASGWGYAAWSLAKPDRMEIEPDKKIYRAGEFAKVLIKAPFSGRLLLTIEKDKVLEFKTYDLDSNTAQIELPIKKEYGPNVYITGTLIKSTTSLERFSPARAFGLAPLMIDNSNVKLTIDIEAPEVIKPLQKLNIRLKTNLKKGTKLTVAAVDMGILQLTNYKTPDPFTFFHGKKRPVLKPYDIYSLLFPDIEAAESKLNPGGSAAYEAARKRHLNPLSAKRVKPVALWSGLIETDSSGAASVAFDVPQFNGKLIIMAVGFNSEKCGSATGEVTVRDKIVIQDNLPRFVAPGDRVNSQITVFNNTGQADSFTVSMKIDGAAKLISAQSVKSFIEADGKSIAKFVFKATNKPGKVTFDMAASNGQEKSAANVEMTNRPAQPLFTEDGSGAIKAGTPVQLILPDKWLEGTAQYDLKLSSLPSIRLAKSIQYLLTYPYGCIEQTTSTLFPLLYFNDLARIVQPAIFGTKGQDYFVDEGIAKISGMQLPSGAFFYWPGISDPNPWASVYASHFLVEARKAGYKVNDSVYDKMIDNLMSMANKPKSISDKGQLRIYAAYVLAKAGKLEKSVVNNLKLLNIIEIPVYSRFQLAAAIAMTGSLNEAKSILPTEIHAQKFDPETGGYFDSDIRANAILLDVLSELEPDNASIPELVKELSEEMYEGHWYTTQSNAFALMAIGKYFRSQGQPNYTGDIEIDGVKYKQFTTKDVHISDQALGGKNITISITGEGNCYYYWQASGVSLEKTADEFDRRIQVRRQYLTADGLPLDLKSIKLGDQIVAEITVMALDKALENVAINDLLPACFEMENPRLQTTGKLTWIPSAQFEPSYMDIRDDRVLLFANLSPQYKFTHYYSLRVVSSGEFVVPPIAAECMYDPTVASSASSNTAIVTGNE